MSTPNVTSTEASPEPVARLRPRGTVWTVLRVHRVALWVWITFVVLVVAGAVWLHFEGLDIREAKRLCTELKAEAFCTEGSAVVPGWDHRSLMDLTAFLIAGVPFAVAAYAGGVYIGGDFEAGTVDLLWTQSVSPLRWLAVKLGLAALLIAAGTAAMALAFRLAWLSGEENLLDPWYASGMFNAMGPAVLAYALLALALGTLVALLTGRAMPALGAAFGLTLLVRLLGDIFRSELWPKDRWDWRGRMPDDAQEFRYEVPDARSTGADQATREIMQIHPASHFWPIQLVETLLLLGMAGLAVAVTFWALRGRLP
ncbi:hypothetical protein [Streptomyces sp. WMMB 322]|uniref:hypothetical protein n=1 Tax=Streptomyces sp. WMMB 322 TaxID=1286821 RepID=UPI0006E2C13E|nr:hypothetical protein [Streptomyces sp. WMMB 322]SCK16942.1 ABC-2 family transporter protein [Streptomyces sp. WMMB 322]